MQTSILTYAELYSPKGQAAAKKVKWMFSTIATVESCDIMLTEETFLRDGSTNCDSQFDKQTF